MFAPYASYRQVTKNVSNKAKQRWRNAYKAGTLMISYKQKKNDLKRNITIANCNYQWQGYHGNRSENNQLEMGCLCTRDQNEDISDEVVAQKTYSWEEKKKFFNPSDFIVEDLIDKEEIRLPGSVNGQQFIIQNCKDSTIYVLDYINTVTIDGCINCKIILGPVEGSAFIRNCISCTCVVACGQFRVRDSTKINVFLFSATQPIIEASSGIQFGSYQLKYNNIQDHFQKSNLNCENKNWKFIYDFTPIECEQNWSFMKNNDISEFVSEPKSEVVKNELINLGYSWLCKQESENESENTS